MASNLKALLVRSTSLTAERASILVNTDMAANAHRHSRASWAYEAMESEHFIDEEPDGPPVRETVMSGAVKATLERVTKCSAG